MNPVLAVLLAMAVTSMPSTSAGADAAGAPAAITVHFSLVDHQGLPIAAEPVRLVLGRGPGWETAGAGHRFSTDARGAQQLTMPASVEPRARKRPTNFVSSLFSRAEPTDYLHVGVELAYGGVCRLHTLELHRFRDGTVLREGNSVLSADARGDFTRRAAFDGITWKLADLDGLALSSPGHEPVEAMLDRGPGADWILKLQYRRAAGTIRR